MKRKRITRNSLRSSSSSQQETVPYLSDEYWELIFKHLPMDDEDYNSLSLVSKRFLSITNRLRFSLTIKYYQTTQQALNLIRRFPNLTSLHLCGHQCGDLDKLLPQISFNLTSLKLTNLHTMPVNGLLDFSLNIKTTLTSLTCSYTDYLTHTHMFLIADCFPNLQLLDFNHCHDISKQDNSCHLIMYLIMQIQSWGFIISDI
ncbi:F-box/LRR-repeat protein [Trifolium repens]|nr:F-box/LRR-repeat protein [Trifolium repens]